jgi:DNA-binding GntR family transcriptional regulator
MPRAASGRIAAKDRALTYVKTQVLSGAFAGGELISEGEVAEALSMSRTPVREAFLRLEAEGLLRLYPQRGALVVPVSPNEVRAVMEARLMLEQFAADKVAGLGQPERDAVFAEMQLQLRRQGALDVKALDLKAEAGDFLEADRAFHTVLVEAAANPILCSVYDSLRDRQLRMVGASVMAPGRIEAIVAEHLDIANAVRAGDADGALEAVKRHLASTSRALGMAVEP